MQLGITDITNLFVNQIELEEILEKNTVKVEEVENFSVGDILSIKEISERTDETGNEVTATIVGMNYLEEEKLYELTLEKSFYITKKDGEGKRGRTHYMHVDKSVYSHMDYGGYLKGCVIFYDFKPNDLLQVIVRNEKGRNKNISQPLTRIKEVYKEPGLDEVTLKITKIFL